MQHKEKEYEFLQDLCAHYLVSRKNPWTDDGKARRKMVADVWEGMSNVNSTSFKQAKKSVQQGQKLGDLQIHSGYRTKLSLQELEQGERARKVRIREVRAEKKELKRQQEAQKAQEIADENVQNQNRPSVKKQNH